MSKHEIEWSFEGGGMYASEIVTSEGDEYTAFLEREPAGLREALTLHDEEGDEMLMVRIPVSIMSRGNVLAYATKQVAEYLEI